MKLHIASPLFLIAALACAGAWGQSNIFTATGGSAASGGTTAAKNSTGSTLIVATIAHYIGSGGNVAPVLTDSQTNSWTKVQMTADLAGNDAISTYFCINPSCGTAHTFTTTGATQYGLIVVAGFSGVNQLSGSDGRAERYVVSNFATSGSTLSPGSLTTTSGSNVLISCIGGFGTAYSIDSSFVSAGTGARVSSVATGCGMAYLLVSGTATRTPTWTYTGNPNASHMLLFSSSAAVAGGGTVVKTSVDGLWPSSGTLFITGGSSQTTGGTPGSLATATSGTFFSGTTPTGSAVLSAAGTYNVGGTTYTPGLNLSASTQLNLVSSSSAMGTLFTGTTWTGSNIIVGSGTANIGGTIITPSFWPQWNRMNAVAPMPQNPAVQVDPNIIPPAKKQAANHKRRTVIQSPGGGVIIIEE